MKRKDWKTIFTALSFVAIVANKKGAASAGLRDEVLRLADLIEEFCLENVVNVSAMVSDGGEALLMDEVIEKHLRELRDEGSTELPEDRQLLVKLHDRLQHRKARRMDREFYAFATEQRIADAVLGFLDDELDGGDRARLA
jgi:hypothetical protein